VAPLAGVRIVVTRAAHQAEELARPLRDLGAQVILLPVIDIGSPSDPEPLRNAAAHSNRYDWIIFTSANAIRAFVVELPFPVPMCTARTATVGVATRRIAEEHGFTISLTPQTYTAEALVEAFGEEDLSGKQILIPSAAITRDVVATELRRRGARVDVVEAYRNVLPRDAASRATEIFREPFPDWVTFASSSAVDNLVRLVGADTLRHVKIASIGPITSETARARGLEVAAEANLQTVEGLIEVLCSCSGAAGRKLINNALDT
jgi:uroporphyrinogen III methyltransferase / synthase